MQHNSVAPQSMHVAIAQLWALKAPERVARVCTLHLLNTANPDERHHQRGHICSANCRHRDACWSNPYADLLSPCHTPLSPFLMSDTR